MDIGRSIFKALDHLTTAVLVLLFAGCMSSPSGEKAAAKQTTPPQEPGDAIPVLGIRVLKSHPHDPDAFTQGLEYFDGFLYESTGEVGHSSVRKVDLESGKVRQKEDLSPPHFGEGLTIFRSKVYQLTWLTKTGFVYDLRTLRRLKEFHFDGEGWGLTHDHAS